MAITTRSKARRPRLKARNSVFSAHFAAHVASSFGERLPKIRTDYIMAEADPLASLPRTLARIFDNKPHHYGLKKAHTATTAWAFLSQVAKCGETDAFEEPLLGMPYRMRYAFSNGKAELEETTSRFFKVSRKDGRARSRSRSRSRAKSPSLQVEPSTVKLGTIQDGPLPRELTLPTPSTPKSTARTSSFFSPTKRHVTSSLPFPSLASLTFGLIQEELASQPFRVLVAVLFLVKTKGTVSIPVIKRIFDSYPTPETLAAAQPEDLYPDIAHLGLQNRRAQAVIELAKAWVANPPQMGKRYRRLNYPTPGSGKDIHTSEVPLVDEDPRHAYEVAHLPHIGPYGIDSWRIFCRDDLRNVRSGPQKKSLKRKYDAVDTELRQEWTRVMPGDKELRAYVRWRWLRLGFDWDAETGLRRKVKRKVLKKMESGTLSEWKGFGNPWQNQSGRWDTGDQ